MVVNLHNLLVVYLLLINYYYYYALNLDELWFVNFGCLDCFELMVVYLWSYGFMVVYLWSYGLMVIWYFQTNSVL
jgi:hypothetical protein